MTDEQHDFESPAPRWWNILMLAAVAILVLVFFSGCAEAPQRPVEMAHSYDACVAGCAAVHNRPAQPVPASRDSRDAVIRVLAEALVARNQLAPMAQCVRECGAVPVQYENTVQIVHQTNAQTVGHIGGMARIPLSIMAGGWSAARIAEAGGQTTVTNTAQGGSTAAGRNVVDDHSAPVDITSGTIGGDADAEGDGGDVELAL